MDLFKKEGCTQQHYCHHGLVTWLVNLCLCDVSWCHVS